jgi:hypothetical protein
MRRTSLAIVAASIVPLHALGCGSASPSGTGAGTSTQASSSSSSASSTSSTSGTSSSSGSSSTSSGTGGNPSSCSTNAECTNGYVCNPDQSLPPFCGATCVQTGLGPGCTSDASCASMGANFICDGECTCYVGPPAVGPASVCIAGCTKDADCGPSLACNTMHRCKPAACSSAAPCTGDFTCSGGFCAAKPCTTDADCAGHCVSGACSATAGRCVSTGP